MAKDFAKSTSSAISSASTKFVDHARTVTQAGLAYALAAGGVLAWVRAGLTATAEGERIAYLFGMISREVASVFLPIIRDLINVLQRVLNFFRSLTGEQQRLISMLVLTAAAVKLVGLAFAYNPITGWIAAFATLAYILEPVGYLFGKLLDFVKMLADNPLGQFILEVAVLTYAIGALSGQFFVMVDSLSGIATACLYAAPAAAELADNLQVLNSAFFYVATGAQEFAYWNWYAYVSVEMLTAETQLLLGVITPLAIEGPAAGTGLMTVGAAAAAATPPVWTLTVAVVALGAALKALVIANPILAIAVGLAALHKFFGSKNDRDQVSPTPGGPEQLEQTWSRIQQAAINQDVGRRQLEVLNQIQDNTARQITLPSSGLTIGA